MQAEGMEKCRPGGSTVGVATLMRTGSLGLPPLEQAAAASSAEHRTAAYRCGGTHFIIEVSTLYGVVDNVLDVVDHLRQDAGGM